MKNSWEVKDAIHLRRWVEMMLYGIFIGWKLAHEWTRLLDVGRTTTTELAVKTHIY
jgi:hypothetical protein